MNPVPVTVTANAALPAATLAGFSVVAVVNASFANSRHPNSRYATPSNV